MENTLLFGLVVLCLVIIYNLLSPSKSCYAPPRDETTEPPFVSNVVAAPFTSQMDVYKDAGGGINQREHPLSPFIQSNAFAGTDMGEFYPIESSSGQAPMTVIPQDEQYEYDRSESKFSEEYLPDITSRAIPLLAQSASLISQA